MCIKTKDSRPVSCLITADAFKDTTAVMQRVRRHMRGGVVPWNHTAIHPYPFRFVKGHSVTSKPPVGENRVNPRSGWQRKAWGGAQRNPRMIISKKSSAR